MQKKHKGRLVPVLCNIIGTLLIVLVFAVTIPLVVPSMMNYESFSVESGSMEPDYPVGSVVYVKACEAQEVRPNDVITFVKEETVITHRVVENHVVEGEFITKGDANPQADIESVPYAALIGRVEYHLPILGAVLTVLASTVGKVYILLVGAIGVMFNILAGRIRATRRRKALEEAREASQAEEKRKAIEEQKRLLRAKYGIQEEPEEESSEGTEADEAAAAMTSESSSEGTSASTQAAAPRKKKHIVRKVIMVILALIFVGAGIGAGSILLQYKHSDEVYANAAMSYTAKSAATTATAESEKSGSDLIPGYLKIKDPAEEAASTGETITSPTLPGSVSNGPQTEEIREGFFVLVEEEPYTKPPIDPAIKAQCIKDLDSSHIFEEKKAVRAMRVLAPIRVDFKSLLDVTEDVKGWIYCADTNINYPVLHGATNNTYLRHTYDGEYNIAGSIFIETDNDPNFKDANTIVYGHHMNDGSMFANLEDWADQKYYEDHPVMWILTPKQDYMLVLVAGYHTAAGSDTYTMFHEPDEEMRAYLDKAVEKSDFITNLRLPLGKNTHYVVLSTCAYIFDNARYVLHGLLVPVDSAGGKPLW